MRRLDLDADPKERAELTMAIDLHRNDLGKVAAPGSVRVIAEPRIALGKTVMSRVAEIVAELEDGRTAAEAVAAMLPAGSVTGAPKVRAMEIIAELEAERRGLYTGMIGTVRRDGGVTLAMAIRTAVIAPGGGAEYPLTDGGNAVRAGELLRTTHIPFTQFYLEGDTHTGDRAP